MPCLTKSLFVALLSHLVHKASQPLKSQAGPPRPVSLTHTHWLLHFSRRYITDYRVVLPTVASADPLDDNELFELAGLDEYYRPRVQFLFACMLRFGHPASTATCRRPLACVTNSLLELHLHVVHEAVQQWWR